MWPWMRPEEESMKVIFNPAIALMNRLSYPAKFFLLGASITAVMLVLLVTVFVNLSKDISTAAHELSGLQMLKPMNRMVQFMQQHRGLSSGVLNGNEAMKDSARPRSGKSAKPWRPPTPAQ